MKIDSTSVFVVDQRKALSFYADVLGFRVKRGIMPGEYSWLTVIAPEDPEGPELLLEPDPHPVVATCRAARVEDRIPLASFAVAVADVRSEYDRLASAGVEFTQPPVELGTVGIAVFDDTCGNLIQIAVERPQS